MKPNVPRRSQSRGPWIAAALLLAGCVTINVYFPEAEIRELSERIEAEVRGEPVSDEEEKPETEPPSSRLDLAGAALDGELRLAGIGALAATVAIATPGQDVGEPTVMTPAIRKIIASRRARFPQLEPWLAQGVLGENNRALLDARALQQVGDLRQRAEVQRLVREENADREQLFREIANAEGVDHSQLPRIQQTYAETLRRVARAGTWIQQPDGAWVQKR
jgi:uncharacterized protein YdbL (DUF1318 family)